MEYRLSANRGVNGMSTEYRSGDDREYRSRVSINNRHNLVPRVLSLLRESTLVTAGHVSKHANPSRTEGGSST